MKTLLSLIFLLALIFPSIVYADQFVNGYVRRDGTYVAPHIRSSPNNTVIDNHSLSGNRNPYNGNIGSNRYEHDTTSPYNTGPDNKGGSGHGSDGFNRQNTMWDD